MTSPVERVVGYVRGTPFDLYVREVDGIRLELATAAIWERMRDAAAVDGIDLRPKGPNSGWRSYEWQAAEYESRLQPIVRKLRGPAAKPGYSNHHRGVAVDIDVGMSVKDLNDRKTSAAFRWLERNAQHFGFKRTVRVEPWHWEFVGFEGRSAA